MTRILIVDDNLRLRRALHLALNARGFEVGNAAGCREALDIVANRLPDLILLDWHLPDIDGIQTCRRLRMQTDRPIIMISGNKSNRAETALKAGANDYLAKPFPITELTARIELALAAYGHKTKPNSVFMSA